MDSKKIIFRTGAIFTILVLFGIILDIIAGNITGGNINSLPQTAIARFQQLHDNCLLGLYNLDLLNTLNQILLIPVYFALYVALRENNRMALLSLIVFLVGTALFIAGNTAMPMLDLSHKYFAAVSEAQKNLLAAGGETMLAKGAHGSFSVFIGFTLPTIGALMMAGNMTRSDSFNKIFSWLGVAGNSLMVLYLVIVTFFPSSGKFALILAMPGGLLIMAWMISFMLRFFRLAAK